MARSAVVNLETEVLEKVLAMTGVVLRRSWIPALRPRAGTLHLATPLIRYQRHQVTTALF
jgi:hypothetical protein